MLSAKSGRSSDLIAMEGKLVTMALLSGFWFLPACSTQVYSVIKEPKSWAKAQMYCRTRHIDLATVQNQAEMEALTRATGEYSNTLLWIGLHHVDEELKWSLQLDGFYNDKDVVKPYENWGNNEPSDDTHAIENCVLMGGDGKFYDASCSKQLAFLCYDAPSSSIVFVDQAMTWTEAQSYCRKQYTDLVSVRHMAENEAIKQAASHQESWIGLHRDPWKWSDGAPVSFTSWAAGDPNGGVNEPCVALHENSWKDVTCATAFPFVCALAPKKRWVVKVRVTWEAAARSLEEAAAAAIMRQVSERMDQLLPKETATLAWRRQPDGRVFHLQEGDEGEEEAKTTCRDQKIYST